jgi:2-aminobenzoate-CoA ligase
MDRLSGPGGTVGAADPFARDHLPLRELWPEMPLTLPELLQPDHLNCVDALLQRHAGGALAERTALVGEQGAWTWTELAGQVDRLVGVLRNDLGLVAGARVLVRGENGLMTAAALLAIWKAGCIAVPTMPLLRAAELQFMLDKARVDAMLCSATLQAEAAALRRPPRHLVIWASGADDALEARMARQSARCESTRTLAYDTCLIAFTSGSTGVPKATMHAHRDLLAVADCVGMRLLGCTSSDVFAGSSSLGFTFGLGALLLFPLRAGATAVLLDRPSPERMLAAIEQYGVTRCFSVPTFYRQLAPLAKGRVASLRTCVSAGEPLAPPTRAAWREATGQDLVDGIGSTEMLHIFAASCSEGGHTSAPPAGALGRAIPGYEVSVLDAQGQPVPPGVTGRLAVRGPTGCRYLDDARQREYVQRGWNITGDAARMDGNGWIYHLGRIDDLIISAGYNIAAPEVEHALLAHAAVAECAVVGHPDAQRGQVVEAHVVLAPGCTASDELAQALQDWVKARIAPYKYPRRVHFTDALPRTESGKLQRFRLRQA